MASENPLISTQKASESSYEIALHPLVLLTISDYITRHTLRQQQGPVVGALLGQQSGREITIEHAFECLLSEVNGEILLNQAWFDERLQHMKDVHKVPQLDLVGWYTVLPTSGPQSAHLPIHRQVLESYNESALLLGFHTSAIKDGSTGGKLPINIYESNFESDEISNTDGEDKEMKDVESQMPLKFKEVSYAIETGEAEMISIDFVARGGGNATAVENSEIKPGVPTDNRILSREDEELIASLTTKANAIKMLQARINLLTSYLKRLPHHYLSNGVSEGLDPDNQDSKWVDHTILRSIQALLSRLPLLVSEDCQAFEQEMMSAHNDVSLISLLSNLTESITGIRQVGVKNKIIGTMKVTNNKPIHHWGGSTYQGVSGVGDLLP